MVHFSANKSGAFIIGINWIDKNKKNRGTQNTSGNGNT